MSQQRPSRRRFLALSSSAAVAGVAGCTSRLSPSSNGSDDDPSDSDDDGGDDSSGSSDGADDPDDSDDGDDGDENGVPDLETEFDSRAEYRQPGDALDDFEDLDAWTVTRGSGEADEDIVFDGSQSLKLTSDGSENILVERSLEGEDLTDLDLSFAIRTTTPQNITINVRVVDYYGSEVISSLREITYRSPDVGWFRSSPGVFEEDEIEPAMDDLDYVQIQVLHSMDEAEVWVDDLRTHEKPDTGYVVLVWDDGFRDYYETASPLHDEFGFRTVQAPVPRWTENSGGDEVMTVSELRERQDEGDQIVVHGTHSPIHELEDEQEIESRIRGDKHWYIENGFEGANYIVYPHNSYDATSLEYFSDYHYCGGFNQSGNVNTTNVYGFDPLALPRTIAHDLEISKRCVDLAGAHNQCTILNFHTFDEDNTMPEDDYEALLEHIDDADVEVITMDDLWELRTEGH